MFSVIGAVALKLVHGRIAVLLGVEGIVTNYEDFTLVGRVVVVLGVVGVVAVESVGGRVAFVLNVVGVVAIKSS